jgi:hypothetical protein
MRKNINEFLLFLVIIFFIRGLYIFVFHNCTSQDLDAWNWVGNILMEGGNPYHAATGCMSWPPLWMQLIFLFKKLSLILHLPFNDVVRAFLTMSESAMALLLYAAVIRYAKCFNATRLLVFGIALNPIPVFQVCQQCNFDVFVGFWILLAVYMLLRFQENHEPSFWLCACFALGMGTLTKTIPICLAPMLLLSVRKVKWLEQLLGAAFLLGPAFLGLSVVYVLGPQDVQTHVFGYRSIWGVFGFTGLFKYFGWTSLYSDWGRIFEIIYGAGWVYAGIWLYSKEKLEPKTMVLVAAALLMAIPAFGPGIGYQYIYWFLPLLLLAYALEHRSVRSFLLIFFAVAVVTYTIVFAFYFNVYGAFFLEIVQTEKLVQFGLWLSTTSHETFLTLPLWLLYLIGTVLFARRIKREASERKQIAAELK